MRIDLNPKSPEAPDAAQSTRRGSRNSAVPGQTAPAEDRAELSLDQVRVRALAAQVNELPEIRQQKVAALSRAIREGNYNVTPEQTAEALVANMLGAVR